jgi:hypothetical protein
VLRGLGLSRDIVLLLSSSSGLRGGSLGGSSRLGLLLRRGVLDGLLDKDGLINNSLPDGLVDSGLIPTSDVGVLATPLLVEHILETARDLRGKGEISQSQALTHKPGVDKKVVLENSKSLGCGSLCVFNVLLVVGVFADQRTEPATESGQNFRVRVRHPANNLRIVLLGLAQEGRFFVLATNRRAVST